MDGWYVFSVLDSMNKNVGNHIPPLTRRILRLNVFSYSSRQMQLYILIYPLSQSHLSAQQNKLYIITQNTYNKLQIQLHTEQIIYSNNDPIVQSNFEIQLIAYEKQIAINHNLPHEQKNIYHQCTTSLMFDSTIISWIKISTQIL